MDLAEYPAHTHTLPLREHVVYVLQGGALLELRNALLQRSNPVSRLPSRLAFLLFYGLLKCKEKMCLDRLRRVCKDSGVLVQ